MEISGTIVRILESKTVGTNGFETRQIHIKTDEQYPQTLDIQFTQGKCPELDNFKPGEKVKIAINIKGREWTNDKQEVVVFNTIQGWKIDKIV
jgi:translation initiation factor IF-3